jgi:hypothetical protein
MQPQQPTSARWKLCRCDLVKLAKSLGLAVAGVSLPILAQWFTDTDFGSTGNAVVAALGPFALNVARKLIVDNTQQAPR